MYETWEGDNSSVQPSTSRQNGQTPFGPLREVVPAEQRTIRPADSHDLHGFVNVQRKKEF